MEHWTLKHMTLSKQHLQINMEYLILNITHKTLSIELKIFYIEHCTLYIYIESYAFDIKHGTINIETLNIKILLIYITQ